MRIVVGEYVVVEKLYYRSWWRSLLSKCRFPISPAREVSVRLPFEPHKNGRKAYLRSTIYELEGSVDFRTGEVKIESKNKALVGYSLKASVTTHNGK